MKFQITATALALLLAFTQVAAADIVVGAGAGGGPHVKRFDGASATESASFFAYPVDNSNGVRVAVGDINGDGVTDMITSLGPGAASHVKAFSGTDRSELRSFFAYDGFTGGVFVAAGDVDGDGFADIVTGADSGAGPHVKVFSGATGDVLRSFIAYPISVSPGVRVAAGDVNGDGFADIVTALGETTAPHVKVFDGVTLDELHSFNAFAADYTGGVYVAAGDLTGDGYADIVTGAGTGATHVKVFDGRTLSEVNSFEAFEGQLGGVRVAVGDIDSDGHNDVVTALGPSGRMTAVQVFDGETNASIVHFHPYGNFFNGTYVAAVPLAVPEPTTALLAVFAASIFTIRPRQRTI
jgi:fibronectin-binding autotransporter adhesin